MFALVERSHSGILLQEQQTVVLFCTPALFSEMLGKACLLGLQHPHPAAK
jgi:hypothetical protein